LWTERYPDVPARSCDEFRSAAGVVKWVRDVIGD
jgi:[acyl-carrier-protein] S-malonyltransferase